MIYDQWVLAESSGGSGGTAPIGHPVLQAILSRRGIEAGEEYRRFIAPSLDDLHDPTGIYGMESACERIERAVRDREAILIYGDYDVDGVTSIVLLQTVIRSLGGDVGFVVPHRLVDGYGLKMEVIDRVQSDRNVRLVITVDCGITSIEPVRRAIERGIDVIITDHHLPPGDLPAAAAVLNPKREGCTYPFKELAGVGVAFKLACELAKRAGRKISTSSLLKIAALGTIADVAPLIGENRTIAWLGLQGLADARNPGLRALLRRLGLHGKPLRAADVGFKIGPRINAAGRLASADTAIDLFAAASEESAWELCAELDRLNTLRQTVEAQVRDEADRLIDPSARIHILAGESWHRGVVGLTAGRLAQKYHRPALVIAIDGDNAVGSGRSISSINLHEHLESVADLFTHFGGHEFACGFSLRAAHIPELRRRLVERMATLDESHFRRELVIDAQMTLAEIDRSFVNAHELLQPFGAGNPQPSFLCSAVSVETRREFAEDCLEVRLRQGEHAIPGVVWPSVRQLGAALTPGATVDLAVQIEPDTWSDNGSRLVVLDVRAAG